jgi:hypothetical protein
VHPLSLEGVKGLDHRQAGTSQGEAAGGSLEGLGALGGGGGGHRGSNLWPGVQGCPGRSRSARAADLNWWRQPALELRINQVLI